MDNYGGCIKNQLMVVKVEGGDINWEVIAIIYVRDNNDLGQSGSGEHG
jgi:hypothetical protein